jgi:chemotaxis protein MotB
MAMPEDDPPPGVPEWVVTYGDMMSLLLTFFIMLVSMSQMKQEGTVRSMLDSISETFGADSGTIGAPGPSLQTNGALTHLASEGSHSEGGTKQAGRKSAGRSGAYNTVTRLAHGTEITLGGPSLFAEGESQLNEALRQNLDVIVRVLSGKTNQVVVRGHATRETLPADSPARDALDLSFARAATVAEYLIAKGIDSRRVRVSAAGDSEPRLITREAQEQRLNRRVDVFLIDSYTTPPQPRESGEP